MHVLEETVRGQEKNQLKRLGETVLSAQTRKEIVSPQTGEDCIIMDYQVLRGVSLRRWAKLTLD